MNLSIDLDTSEAPEQVPTSVESWYDRNERAWVTSLRDQNGEQIGEATYDGTQQAAARSQMRFATLIEESK